MFDLVVYLLNCSSTSFHLFWASCGPCRNLKARLDCAGGSHTTSAPLPTFWVGLALCQPGWTRDAVHLAVRVKGFSIATAGEPSSSLGILLSPFHNSKAIQNNIILYTWNMIWNIISLYNYKEIAEYCVYSITKHCMEKIVSLNCRIYLKISTNTFLH